MSVNNSGAPGTQRSPARRTPAGPYGLVLTGPRTYAASGGVVSSDRCRYNLNIATVGGRAGVAEADDVGAASRSGLVRCDVDASYPILR